MDEKTVLELLSYLQSQPNTFETIQPRLKQSYQVITWAESWQRWDIVIAFSLVLSYHFEFSHPLITHLESRDKTELSESMRYFWEQAARFAEKGLKAAEQVGDQEKQLEFLMNLSRLSGRLNDFETALHYLKQELVLVTPNFKQRLVRDIHLLGEKASIQGQFLVARACYQTSLAVFQEIDNKDGIAEVLAFMAANESARLDKRVEKGLQNNDELHVVIDSLWELSGAFRQEAKLGRTKSTNTDKIDETITDSLYGTLKNTLVKLEHLT